LSKDFCFQNDVAFDFVVITANKFKSGFTKDEVEKIIISFPEFNKEAYIKDVLNVLRSENQRKSFFYLYHRDYKKRIDADKFTRFLIRELF